MSEAVIILQARSGSRRLPGKALAPIGARSLLAHCLARLRIGAAAPVVLATTERREDDALADLAALYGASVFRGPEDDVLGRYVMAAQSVDARYVVRATADNPAVDIDAPARVLGALMTAGVDHVVEDGLPYGAAVEAVKVSALVRASKRATAASDREHVTPMIRRDRTQFKAAVMAAPSRVCAPAVRLTVDTDEDLRAMRTLADRLDGWFSEPELADILAAAAAAATRCA